GCLGAWQGHGSLAHPQGVLITWALMMEGGIQVNAAGRRFSNEHGGYSEQAVKVLSQPGAIAWNIYDDRLHGVGLGFPDYREAIAAGAIHSGADAGALAARTGLPADALEDTLAQVAAFCAGTAADPFGRDFTAKPALSGPLHAVKVTGALFHTQGGLVIDARARVLRPDGSALANLYAGGGAARGVSGSRVEGYLSGNGLLTAVALGFVAGAMAAKQSGEHGSE
ncbi:MAG: FAD-binding protein, partial [Proteobacteria bacterium]|nr:FAD-binding protein [Pseudomonadota bacterium]